MGVAALVNEDRLFKLWDRPHTVWGWLTSVDHKDIGRRYLATAFLFLLLGGIEAVLIRTQLAVPENTLLTPERLAPGPNAANITLVNEYFPDTSEIERFEGGAPPVVQ